MNREKYDGYRTMLDEQEAAELLHCSIDFVRDLRKNGHLAFHTYMPTHQRGRQMVRYRLSVIEEFIEKTERKAKAKKKADAA